MPTSESKFEYVTLRGPEGELRATTSWGEVIRGQGGDRAGDIKGVLKPQYRQAILDAEDDEDDWEDGD